MSDYAQQIAAKKAEQRRKEEEEKLKAAAAMVAEAEKDEGQEAPVSENPSPESAETPDELLTKLPGGPTAEQVRAWREKFSSLYVLPMRRDDAYVWRYLEYKEWKEIQAQLGNVEPDKVEQFIQEAVLKRCVVWPRDRILVSENADKLPAGIVELLYNVIMAGSYFMNTDEALMRVIKL